MAHTPKPWKVERAMVGHSGTVAVKEPRSLDWICSMQVSNQPNWQDDAQLISAAPDLLDALEAWKEYEDGPSLHSWDDIQAMVNEAIAKARGK